MSSNLSMVAMPHFPEGPDKSETEQLENPQT
jgi:hypothetical protein